MSYKTISIILVAKCYVSFYILLNCLDIPGSPVIFFKEKNVFIYSDLYCQKREVFQYYHILSFI